MDAPARAARTTRARATGRAYGTTVCMENSPRQGEERPAPTPPTPPLARRITGAVGWAPDEPRARRSGRPVRADRAAGLGRHGPGVGGRAPRTAGLPEARGAQAPPGHAFGEAAGVADPGGACGRAALPPERGR